ncbi:hypothetical protein Tco_1143265 [Tanacetum coccineum]
MKKTRILTKLYGVTPTIVLRRKLFKARNVTQQDYGVTRRKVYAVTLLIWKDELSESALRHHGFVGYPFDYCVTLGFGSIAGGLDHVNPVIRLPLEHGISRVLGKDDHSNPNDVMDGINIDDLTIEQYLKLTQENQTPSMVKKVDDMTIAEYIEYEERIKRQYSRNSGSYFPTYFSHCTPNNNTTLKFPRNSYFNSIPPNTKFNYDSKDMELDEEAGYTTDEESVMSEHEAIDLVHAVNTQSFEDELRSEEDLDE